MKSSTILSVLSLSFLSYYFYIQNKKEEVNHEEIVMEIEDDDDKDIEEVKEPLTPSQKIVHDHFQLHHR